MAVITLVGFVMSYTHHDFFRYQFTVEDVEKMKVISGYHWDRFGLVALQINYVRDSIQVVFEEDLEVLFSVSEDIENQIEELDIILQDSLDKSRKIRQIDLRFERPSDVL